MIYITKLNEKQIVINSDLILTVESTPDTTISMTTGHKYIARESVDDIIGNVVEYRRRIYAQQAGALSEAPVPAPPARVALPYQHIKSGDGTNGPA